MSITNTVWIEPGDMRDEGTYDRLTLRARTSPGLSARQRLVLDCLEKRGGQLGIVELASLVSARVRGTPTDAVPAAALRRTYCRLAASTIGDLEAKGLLEYREDGTVRLRGEREPLWSPDRP